MKKELIIHFAYWFSFFVFITVLKSRFNLDYWPFWVGGLLGMFLPDLDHVIYVLFMKPQELTSQRMNYLANKKELYRAVQLLYDTRGERKGLIFHTVFFQLLFVILLFWIMSSSGSLFGRGVALSFAIHLLVDQIVDIIELESFQNWLNMFPITISLHEAKIYWVVVAIVTLVIGLFI